MFLVSSCSCLRSIHWSQVLSWEWRCSWSSADRRCSNYIWVINNFIAYKGATYIRGFTVWSVVAYLLRCYLIFLFVDIFLLSDVYCFNVRTCYRLGHSNAGIDGGLRIVIIFLPLWPLRDVAVLLKVWFSNSCCELNSWAHRVKFLSGECYSTLLMISQHCFS